MTNNKNWIEIILMPLVVAFVGIIGTVLVTDQQQKSSETRAAADRQLKLLEIFSQKVSSSEHGERVVAIRLIKALDQELAKKLEHVGAKAIIDGEWVLRRETGSPDEHANWMQIQLSGEDRLIVTGYSWQGEGTFDGEAGYYEWEFKDGKRGRTKFTIDDTGLMRGQVQASGKDAKLPSLNWVFWASKKTQNANSAKND